MQGFTNIFSVMDVWSLFIEDHKDEISSDKSCMAELHGTIGFRKGSGKVKLGRWSRSSAEI
jgi:hypothetical protein